jgi:hypothetical protein
VGLLALNHRNVRETITFPLSSFVFVFPLGTHSERRRRLEDGPPEVSSSPSPPVGLEDTGTSHGQRCVQRGMKIGKKAAETDPAKLGLIVPPLRGFVHKKAAIFNLRSGLGILKRVCWEEQSRLRHAQ